MNQSTAIEDTFVTTLFVGNLSYSVVDPDLRELFAPYGRVTSAHVVFDRTTGRSRGFGFIEFATQAEAAQAMHALGEHEFRGRRLIVNAAKARAERSA